MKVAMIVAALLAVPACKQKEEKKAPAPEATPAPAPTPAPTPTDREEHGVIEEIPPPPRPASFTAEHDAARQTLHDYAEAGRKVVAEWTGDCDAAAAALAKVNLEYAARVAAAHKTLAPLQADPAAKPYLDHVLGADTAGAMDAIALSATCQGHKGVGAAVGAFMSNAGVIAAPPPGEAAGGWTGAHPPGVTDEQVAAIDALGAWFGETSAAAENAHGDCAAMARALGPLAARGKPLAKRTHDTQKDVPTRSPADEWLGQYTMRKVDMKRFILALGPCQKDPAVEKALEAMGDK